jgi:hypothetical protein
VTVTKHINALARSLADVVRTIVIWMIGIIVTVTAGKYYPNYSWEMLGAGALAVEMLGFIILVFGNLIYNRMVKIPFLVGPERNILLIQRFQVAAIRRLMSVCSRSMTGIIMSDVCSQICMQIFTKFDNCSR